MRLSAPVCLILAGSLASLLLTSVGHAQMGPVNPEDLPKPPAKETPNVDKIKDTFSKWFGSNEEGEATEEEGVVLIRKGAGTPGQFDMVTRHRKTNEPSETDKETAVSEAEPKASAEGTRLVPSQSKAIRQPARPPLLSQTPLVDPQVDEPTVSENNPPLTMLTLENESNPYGITASQARLNKTAELIDKQAIVTAKAQLIPLKEWLVDATEAHIGLYKALNKIPSARVQAELEKQVALEFAQMRDTAMYQMARILLAENQPDEAIDLLVEVVKSQPGSSIGLKSYEALQEIGFTQKLQLIEK